MSTKSKGRQKVDMVKIQKESSLKVTFTKRRSGLFKKAAELCTLCDVEVGLIVFSPNQKVYSFGHPCLGSVIDKYQGNASSTDTVGAESNVKAHRAAYIERLQEEYIHVEALLDAARKRGETLDQMKKKCQDYRRWWEAPVVELNVQQLEELVKAMEGLKMHVDRGICNRAVETTNSHTYGQEMTIFGRNMNALSNVRRAGMGSFNPWGVGTEGAYGLSGFSPFSVSREIDEFPVTANINHRASGSGSSNFQHA